VEAAVRATCSVSTPLEVRGGGRASVCEVPLQPQTHRGGCTHQSHPAKKKKKEKKLHKKHTKELCTVLFSQRNIGIETTK